MSIPSSFTRPAVAGTKSASSQSFRDSANFVKLTGPALGAVVVFWRISPNSGKGHVGFYVGEDGEAYYVLGGNQGDAVSVVRISRDRLLKGGVRWPASVPLGTAGPRQMALGKGFSTYEA